MTQLIRMHYQRFFSIKEDLYPRNGPSRWDGFRWSPNVCQPEWEDDDSWPWPLDNEDDEEELF